MPVGTGKASTVPDPSAGGGDAGWSRSEGSTSVGWLASNGATSASGGGVSLAVAGARSSAAASGADRATTRSTGAAAGGELMMASSAPVAVSGTGVTEGSCAVGAGNAAGDDEVAGELVRRLTVTTDGGGPSESVLVDWPS